MPSSFLLALILFQCYEDAFAQTNTIVFTGGSSSNQISTGRSGCTCVPEGTCQTTNSMAIDIRIVNSGSNCPLRFVNCCNGTSAMLTDNSCGIRKIPATQQPMGQASFGAYPWQAALLTLNNDYIGSGVLLDETNVLTVAHKVVPYMTNQFKVRLGEWDGQETSEQYPYQEYSAVRVSVHPSYNAENLQNDVAVIRLNNVVPITTSPNINTACLRTGLPPPNTRCWVSGWGKNAFGPPGNYQGIMREVDVPIVDSSDCQTRLRGTRLGQFFTLNGNSFLCAGGEPGKDACTGDGGSPLVCQSGEQWQVVGMVAWGIGCGTSGIPGVYINVNNFIEWINMQRQQSV